jgi:AcrR family transcriptional regulator
VKERAQSSAAGPSRRGPILEAAKGVFLRYGLKKTSMDDLARAAKLSRQGLYLHFQTKEELFKAVTLELIADTRAASKAALANEGIDVEARIFGAFDAAHGRGLGQLASEHLDELLAAAAAYLGADAVNEVDEGLVADVARLLRTSGIAAHWKDAGLSATELAQTLHAASKGLKYSARTHEAYRDPMRHAIRLVCRGGARG